MVIGHSYIFNSVSWKLWKATSCLFNNTSMYDSLKGNCCSALLMGHQKEGKIRALAVSFQRGKLFCKSMI